ncbi:MAG: sigma-54-dependent Fis family transcriptional regulator [Candidatus Sumerlaeia bacterium]|nr:sigma-54-dependent Fis family transcriptional regulator [Candidatus Sumerlaeia bacterium]
MTDHPGKLLILDDEPDMLEGFRRILSLAGHEVITYPDPTRIRDLLETHRPDAVLTDLRMPGLDGMGVLEAAMESDPDLPVVILTAFGTIESAVHAVKAGAFDYLTKPVDRNELIGCVRRALAHRHTNGAARAAGHADALEFACSGLIGESPAMTDVKNLLRKVARTDANVLFTGESGTGKEVVARCLHTASHRRARPFIPIDCAALPETLLESELFGHERGAFTGAQAQKPGILELAEGGTILLDEIGEMAPALQSKLLRVVQERCFRRVGGRREIRVNVRILSATNRDLEARSAQGLFRQDLFFRLNVIGIHLPPLRERRGDVTRLARHFFDRFVRTTDKTIHGLAPETFACLEAHPWPGNVRELQNVVERAVVLSDGPWITPADLPPDLAVGTPAPCPVPATVPAFENDAPPADFHQAKDRLVSRFERDYLTGLLRNSGGNISHAATVAGINRRTLYRLIEKFDIDLSDLRS